MKEITSFNAIYCSGLVIPNQATIAALSLIFEKTYIPNNIEYVIDFSKKYRINGATDYDVKGHEIRPMEGTPEKNPFAELTEKERKTAFKYIEWSKKIAIKNYELFGNIFETKIFESGTPLRAELVKKGKNGGLNKYKVYESQMTVVEEDKETIPSLIKRGYVPVIGDFHGEKIIEKFDSRSPTAKELATLLAMKSIEMFFPATKDIPAELILEARDKLSEHLPVFWSSMLKLSKDLRVLTKDINNQE